MRVYKDKGQVQSGGSAFEISTPYLTAELFDIKFSQSADVMYILILITKQETFKNWTYSLDINRNRFY